MGQGVEALFIALLMVLMSSVVFCTLGTNRVSVQVAAKRVYSTGPSRPNTLCSASSGRRRRGSRLFMSVPWD